MAKKKVDLSGRSSGGEEHKSGSRPSTKQDHEKGLPESERTMVAKQVTKAETIQGSGRKAGAAHGRLKTDRNRLPMKWKSLELQIQPDLRPDWDAATTANRVRDLARESPFSVRTRLTKGGRSQPYINVRFYTHELKKLWSVLRGELRRDKDL